MLRLYQRLGIALTSMIVLAGCGSVAPPRSSTAPAAAVGSPTPAAQPTQPPAPASPAVPALTPVVATQTPAVPTETLVPPTDTLAPIAVVPSSTAVAPTALSTISCGQADPDRLTLAPGVAGNIKPLPLTWPVQEGGALAISPAFLSDQTLSAGGADGLYLSTDSGASWRHRVSSPVRITRFSPSYAEDRTIFALGASKKTDSESTIHVYRSADGGATWADLEIASIAIQPVDKARLALSPTYAQDRTLYVLIFGYVAYSEGHQAGAVYRSTDGGNTWNEFPGPSAHDAPPYPYDIALSPGYASDHALVVESMAIGGAVSSGNGLYHSIDGGKTWTRRYDVQMPLFTALMLLPSQQIFGGQQRSPLQLRPGGTVDSVQSGSWLTQGEVVVSPAYANDRTLFGIASCATGKDIRYRLVRVSDAVGLLIEVLPLGTQDVLLGVALGPASGYTIVIVSKQQAWRIQLDI